MESFRNWSHLECRWHEMCQESCLMITTCVLWNLKVMSSYSERSWIYPNIQYFLRHQRCIVKINQFRYFLSQILVVTAPAKVILKGAVLHVSVCHGTKLLDSILNLIEAGSWFSWVKTQKRPTCSVWCINNIWSNGERKIRLCSIEENNIIYC